MILSTHYRQFFICHCVNLPLVLELGEKIERELNNKTLLTCGTVSVLDSKALLGYGKSPAPLQAERQSSVEMESHTGQGCGSFSMLSDVFDRRYSVANRDAIQWGNVLLPHLQTLSQNATTSKGVAFCYPHYTKTPKRCPKTGHSHACARQSGFIRLCSC